MKLFELKPGAFIRLFAKSFEAENSGFLSLKYSAKEYNVHAVRNFANMMLYHGVVRKYFTDMEYFYRCS